MTVKIASRAIVCLLATTLFATVARADDIAKFDAAAALVPQPIAEAGVLRIAMPDQGKPFAYKDGNDLKGMDPDEAYAIAATLGLKPEITLIPFASALTGLQADKFDISFGDFYIRAERLEIADFVTSWRGYNTFLLKADKGMRPTKVSDLCGYRAASMAGSVQQDQLEKNANACSNGTIEVSSFPTIVQAVLALSSDRVDVVFTDPGIAMDVTKSDSSYITSGELGAGVSGIAIQRSDRTKGLKEAVQAALQHLEETGDYQKVLDANGMGFGAVKTFDIYDENSTPPTYE